jgi:hypothetical protein
MISYESVPLTGTFTNKIKGYAYLTFFKRPRLIRVSVVLHCACGRGGA